MRLLAALYTRYPERLSCGCGTHVLLVAVVSVTEHPLLRAGNRVVCGTSHRAICVIEFVNRKLHGNTSRQEKSVSQIRGGERGKKFSLCLDGRAAWRSSTATTGQSRRALNGHRANVAPTDAGVSCWFPVAVKRIPAGSEQRRFPFENFLQTAAQSCGIPYESECTPYFSSLVNRKVALSTMS